MRISDWSSDVCSSDLGEKTLLAHIEVAHHLAVAPLKIPEHGQGLADTPILELRFLQVEHETLGRLGGLGGQRSEERRVGKECVSACRSRGSPCHSKNNT